MEKLLTKPNLFPIASPIVLYALPTPSYCVLNIVCTLLLIPKPEVAGLKKLFKLKF